MDHLCHFWLVTLTTSYKKGFHSRAAAGPGSTCSLYTLLMDLQHDPHRVGY